MTGIPALVDRRLRSARRAPLLLPHLGDRAGGAVGDAQPARFAPGPRDPRAQGRARDGRGVRRRRRAAQDRRVRLRGAARVHFGLAVRASAALRQSDAVQHQPGHRVPVHGGRRRRGQRMGRGGRRDADHAAEGAAAGHACRACSAGTGNFEMVVFGILMVLLLQFARDGLWPLVARVLPQRTPPPVPDAPPLPCPRAAPPSGSAARSAQGAQAVRRPRRGERPVVLDPPGEILGLIGPNGAGKSTTFSLISGALPLTAGDIAFRGRSDRQPAALRNRAARHRPHVPAREADRADDRARQRRAGRVPARPSGRRPRRAAARPRRGSAHARRSARARSSAWVSQRTCSTPPEACRSASSASSRSRARSPRIPRCCCSTSLRRACATRRSRRSPRCCARCGRRHDHPAGRARHGIRHGPDRPPRGDGFRREARRRQAGRGPARSGRARSVPGWGMSAGPQACSRRRCMSRFSKSAISACPTARSRRCIACRSTSARGASSP